ncbi:MAG TPA: alpha/beta hydrolase [Vicinamibacterales bacterium]|nr:alpha/beta hydrolase [Vicinamibacterales bacterium]
MEKVISKDGTPIAVDRLGSGPALILVDGAMCSRGFGPMPPLARELASQFTVYHYDRRGRGDSGDAEAYEVQREIDDLAAVLQYAGGTAMVFGISSGAALAAEAARQLRGIRRLALYEAPYVIDNTHEPLPPTFIADTKALVAGNRRTDAVKKFMRYVGTPGIVVFFMPMLPFWKKLTAIAHTLPNDLEIIAPHHNSRPFPDGKWASVTVPTLVMAGGKSPAYMQNSMRSWAKTLPNAGHRTLEGQTHMVKQSVLAPALINFFALAPVTATEKELALQR